MSLSFLAYPARIVPGHHVASGQNGNPLFPGGTLKMQKPFFQALGLDLSPYHVGTLNVSIAPLRYRVIAPRPRELNQARGIPLMIGAPDFDRKLSQQRAHHP